MTAAFNSVYLRATYKFTHFYPGQPHCYSPRMFIRKLHCCLSIDRIYANVSTLGAGETRNSSLNESLNIHMFLPFSVLYIWVLSWHQFSIKQHEQKWHFTFTLRQLREGVTFPCCISSFGQTCSSHVLRWQRHKIKTPLIPESPLGGELPGEPLNQH